MGSVAHGPREGIGIGMGTIETKNAVITFAHIDIERGSFLTVWIGLDYGGVNQNFGGYALYIDYGMAKHESSERKKLCGYLPNKI